MFGDFCEGTSPFSSCMTLATKVLSWIPRNKPVGQEMLTWCPGREGRQYHRCQQVDVRVGTHVALLGRRVTAPGGRGSPELPRYAVGQVQQSHLVVSHYILPRGLLGQVSKTLGGGVAGLPTPDRDGN